MIRKNAKNDTRQKVHDRIRKKMTGTPERPRLNVYRSVNHIYAQVIDDQKGVTLVSASSLEAGKNGKTHITHQGRVRSRWLPLPRSREGACGSSACSGVAVLGYKDLEASKA